MTAEIIQLRPIKTYIPIEKVCSNCDHFSMNRKGWAFCGVFGSEIIDESADDCPFFENSDGECGG